MKSVILKKKWNGSPLNDYNNKHTYWTYDECSKSLRKLDFNNTLLHLILGLGIYGCICTRIGYVISGRVPGYPHHLGLRRNQSFLRKKTGWKQNLSRNSYIWKQDVPKPKIYTHWNPIFLKFVDYILLIYHNLM